MKKIITIISVIAIAGIGYWLYQSMTTPEELSAKEQACINSGGQVSTSLCCQATGDFPNLCLVGPCGCSPNNSHQVKICNCEEGKCFDGNTCIALEVENKLDQTKDWNEYKNEKYGYSLKYPENCLYGPLPGYCKQSPPEERPRECLCYFNAEDPNSVSLGTFTGTKSDLTGASFVVFHSIYVDSYSPPAGTDLVEWVKENFPHYDDIPDEINMEIDGIPALRVYTPFSGMAWSQEDIYFIKDDKVFKISMLNVDDEGNRALYDKILFTFSVEELSQCAKDGEQFSTANNKYPDRCCEGLKEWSPIPDTRFSIADVCYEMGPPSESNIGICIKCGDGVCENHLNYDENPCNCSEDCAGKNKSHFSSIEEFCQSNDWNISLSKACEETIKDFPICKLCNF